MSFRLRYMFCGLFVVLCLFWCFTFGPLERTKCANAQISANGGLVDVNSPFIFIGGIPRSGTTLMRAMLDAHPIVRCGEETRVIPRILALRAQWKKSEKEWKRLQEAGVDDNVINAAISSFIVQVIAGHGAPAERLCNKDPFTLKSTIYLAELFPRSKFVLMIRDGRATVHSIISRKVTITGFNLNDFRQCLTKWNSGIGIMYEQCNSTQTDLTSDNTATYAGRRLDRGSNSCRDNSILNGTQQYHGMIGLFGNVTWIVASMAQWLGNHLFVKICRMMVYYEQLVLHPEPQMKRLLRFLDIPWNTSVLNHEALIGKDIKLSKTERSTDQVVKPVNLDALTKWVGKIPEDVVAEMASIAPMLNVLGYDPHANPPNYGIPDEIVLRKTKDVHEHGDEWYRKGVENVNDPQRVDPPHKPADAPLPEEPVVVEN